MSSVVQMVHGEEEEKEQKDEKWRETHQSLVKCPRCGFITNSEEAFTVHMEKHKKELINLKRIEIHRELI
jgi:uncharacterized C2H2 Zn-finger protein